MPMLMPQMTVDQRLERIEDRLARICFELDLAIQGLQHLLVAQGHLAKAADIGEQLEGAHQERQEAAEEAERRERDTLPPEST